MSDTFNLADFYPNLDKPSCILTHFVVDSASLSEMIQCLVKHLIKNKGDDMYIEAEKRLEALRALDIVKYFLTHYEIVTVSKSGRA